jgi:hypothetical protein
MLAERHRRKSGPFARAWFAAGLLHDHCHIDVPTPISAARIWRAYPLMRKPMFRLIFSVGQGNVVARSMTVLIIQLPNFSSYRIRWFLGFFGSDRPFWMNS